MSMGTCFTNYFPTPPLATEEVACSLTSRVGQGSTPCAGDYLSCRRWGIEKGWPEEFRRRVQGRIDHCCCHGGFGGGGIGEILAWRGHTCPAESLHRTKTRPFLGDVVLTPTPTPRGPILLIVKSRPRKPSICGVETAASLPKTYRKRWGAKPPTPKSQGFPGPTIKNKRYGASG